VSKKRILIETTVVLSITLLLCKIVYFSRFIPAIHEYLSTITALILIYLPFLYLWWRRLPFDFIERDEKSLKTAVIYTLVMSLIFFPPFLLVNHLYQNMFFGFSFNGWHYPGLMRFLIFQIFLIALPEEFFFRGFIQSQMNRVFPARFKTLGFAWGWALPLTAFIFALSHTLITFQWWHFSIFFPGLLFGFLREKTNGLIAPIIIHGISNVMVQGIGYMYLH
jgi:uncharacterized protein